MHLEAVGAVTQLVVVGLTGFATKVFEDVFTRSAQGKVVAYTDFEVTEQTYAGTDVPRGVHVAAIEVGTRTEVVPTHVLQGKAKLRTGCDVDAGSFAQTDVVAQVDGNFDGAVLRRLALDV